MWAALAMARGGGGVGVTLACVCVILAAAAVVQVHADDYSHSVRRTIREGGNGDDSVRLDVAWYIYICVCVCRSGAVWDRADHHADEEWCMTDLISSLSFARSFCVCVHVCACIAYVLSERDVGIPCTSHV